MAEKGGRKTRAQRAEEKRQKRVRMWMGVFIIGIMVLSSFAFVLVFYAPQEGTQDSLLRGYDYTVTDNALFVEFDDQTVPFYSFPDQSIPLDVNAMELIESADILVIAFNASQTADLPFLDAIRLDLATFLPGLQVGSSILEPSDAYNLPVGGCEQASPGIVVMRVELGSPAVTMNGSCVILSGQQQTYLLVRDQIIYDYRGVR